MKHQIGLLIILTLIISGCSQQKDDFYDEKSGIKYPIYSSKVLESGTGYSIEENIKEESGKYPSISISLYAVEQGKKTLIDTVSGRVNPFECGTEECKTGNNLFNYTIRESRGVFDMKTGNKIGIEVVPKIDNKIKTVISGSGFILEDTPGDGKRIIIAHKGEILTLSSNNNIGKITKKGNIISYTEFTLTGIIQKDIDLNSLKTIKEISSFYKGDGSEFK